MSGFGVVVGLPAEARRLPADPRLRVAVTGADPEAAYRAAIRLAGEGVSALASVGVAAGLRADLRSGDVVIGTTVTSPEDHDTIHCDKMLIDRLFAAVPRARTGRLVTVLRPVMSPTEKADLARRCEALAADMESLAVLRAAAAAGLPAIVLRVVLDPADRAIPPSALAGGPGGGSPGAVAAALARRPWEIPAVIRLAGDYARALASLRRAAPALLALADER
ncbi:MAG: nucleoside phosphorylase [Azospirillaceae bacterium]